MVLVRGKLLKGFIDGIGSSGFSEFFTEIDASAASDGTKRITPNAIEVVGHTARRRDYL
ncbi:hypothetical protein D3C81_1903890 [compost metagenome]